MISVLELDKVVMTGLGWVVRLQSDKSFLMNHQPQEARANKGSSQDLPSRCGKKAKGPSNGPRWRDEQIRRKQKMRER